MAIGAGGGAVLGKVLPAAMKPLSTKLKGDIGESLSATGLKLTGQKISQTPARNGVGKSTFDFKLGSGKFVESKFGTGKLSTPQRAAAKQQGSNLEVHYWDYPTTSGLPAAGIGAGAASAPTGEQ